MGEVVTQFFALVGGADEGVGHELVVATFNGEEWSYGGYEVD